MAGQLERVMWGFDHYINDKALKEQFQELYAKVVEENKNNVIAFIPVGQVDCDKLDISNYNWIEDYEINSGTRKYEDDEFDTEVEYIAHIKTKADEKFGKYEIKEQPNDDEEDDHSTIHAIYDDEGEEVDWEYLEGEAKETIERLKQDWIEEQPEFEDLEMEYHEIYWNTVWRFNNHLDREVANKIGLGHLAMNESGDEYLFLLGCGMDLTPKIVAYQALTHGYIDESYLRYFQSDISYTKHVMGQSVWNEVIEKLDIKRFFEEEGSGV
ncbi:hypothetical protein M5X02_31485 [Paenibacillus alvei]|uniref:hypothetical protein n=1 Tax=Paenibacillus alvei TaxID=44250 RepID=UPI000289D0AC|nr:hypothetical protein [Paenibacillus alvei]EJW14082.1 hypothetical protein PAV_141p01880 [Paenibacillus alvei DSM 29]MCY9545151.1 hypothetical protein [Paenibacillus alvei]MCY9707767.1 hypothetical protein [Paenibacillus alvei]MEC0082720.1 hypothetical protein [Paenibacillus alvei]